LRNIYRLVVGNGYYPLVAGVWLVAVLVVGLALISTNRDDIVPVRAAEAQTAYETHEGRTGLPPLTAEISCESHPGYPCMNSYMFTVDTVLPLAATTTRPEWVVSPTGTVWLTVALPVLKVVVWALAALLLAGVTGLLRKT